jgi:hypothetical protein
MTRDDAEQLMRIYSSIGDLLNSADSIIRNISDENEKKRLLRLLGEMMADLWLKLESPIVKQFPDLDPDK